MTEFLISVCVMGGVVLLSEAFLLGRYSWFYGMKLISHIFFLYQLHYCCKIQIVSVLRMHENNTWSKKKNNNLFSFTLFSVLIENTISAITSKYNIPWVKHHSTAPSYLLPVNDRRLCQAAQQHRGGATLPPCALQREGLCCRYCSPYPRCFGEIRIKEE